jgi:hypothetical protein
LTYGDAARKTERGRGLQFQRLALRSSRSMCTPNPWRTYTGVREGSFVQLQYP